MAIKIIYYGDQVFSGDNPFSNTLIPKQSKLKFAVGVCYVRITLIGLRGSIDNKSALIQGGRFKNTFELLNRRALKIPPPPPGYGPAPNNRQTITCPDGDPIH